MSLSFRERYPYNAGDDNNDANTFLPVDFLFEKEKATCHIDDDAKYEATRDNSKVEMGEPRIINRLYPAIVSYHEPESTHNHLKCVVFVDSLLFEIVEIPEDQSFDRIFAERLDFVLKLKVPEDDLDEDKT